MIWQNYVRSHMLSTTIGKCQANRIKRRDIVSWQPRDSPVPSTKLSCNLGNGGEMRPWCSWLMPNVLCDQEKEQWAYLTISNPSTPSVAPTTSFAFERALEPSVRPEFPINIMDIIFTRYWLSIWDYWRLLEGELHILWWRRRASSLPSLLHRLRRECNIKVNIIQCLIILYYIQLFPGCGGTLRKISAEPCSRPFLAGLYFIVRCPRLLVSLSLSNRSRINY